MPKKMTTLLQQSPELSRHRRCCTICRHPDREAIEQEFLHWHNPGGSMGIARYYKVPERSIYRHALATGLLAHRSRTLRFALEHIIERAENAPANANAVIRAVQAYTRLTADGRWVEPARNVVYTVNRSSSAPKPSAKNEPAEFAPLPPSLEDPGSAVDSEDRARHDASLLPPESDDVGSAPETESLPEREPEPELVAAAHEEA